MKKKLLNVGISISLQLFRIAVDFVGFSVYVYLVDSNMVRGANYTQNELPEYLQYKFGHN